MNARELHFDSIVVDTHADTIQRQLDDGEDLTVRTDKGHLDLVRMKEGGIDAQFFSCWVDPKYIKENQAADRAYRMIEAVQALAAKAPTQLELAKTEADVRRIVSAKKIAGLLCIEGGHAIEDSLDHLRRFHELGVRYMTLTWNNTNNWADGCGGPGKHDGLTEFGREVVREMNRLGMIVDITHVAEKTFWDAIGIVDKPVLCSHSNAKAVCDHRRNLTDDQLRAVAKNGGVISTVFYSAFVSPRFAKESSGLGDEEEAKLEPPPLEDLFLHIDHMVKVAGVDHVGIGGDYDGCHAVPKGLEDGSNFPVITEGLVKRGYKEEDVRKILGENVLRVLKENAG